MEDKQNPENDNLPISEAELQVIYDKYPGIPKDAALKIAELEQEILEFKRVVERQQELRRKAEILARVDGLTGLPNRNGLEYYSEKAFGHASRHIEPISVGLIDLDGFKGINDNLGHDAGDKVLKAVVKALQGGTRQEDILGRWGGDEFVVIFPSASEDNAPGMVQRIKGTLREILKPENRERLGIPEIPERLEFGISIGVVQWNGRESLKEVINRADQAMYKQKREKKNEK